ncbi:hypothetical protein [Dyadobacter sp. OTU695]|uniref:hypothetical protein n=1 Tax=Dyadobacter sp. OTU695 TaxID=3043860 RepID=UPI00313A768C
MRLLFFITAIMLLASCCNTHVEVIYEYKGLVIKRVDECGISTFYYGDISNNSPRVWVEYSGINDGFSGYLVFGEREKVMLLSGDGYFKSANSNVRKLGYRRIAAHERPTSGKGVYYVMLATKAERERNMNTGSEVKVFYDD